MSNRIGVRGGKRCLGGGRFRRQCETLGHVTHYGTWLLLSLDGRVAFMSRVDRLTRNLEVDSLRMDIPKTDLPPDRVPQKGGNESSMIPATI